MSLPATYAFTGAANALLPDPPWFASKNTLKVDGSNHGAPAQNLTDCLGVWDNDTFANNQYSQVTAQFTGLGTGTDYIYLLVRAPAASWTTSSFYWFWSDGGSDTAVIKSVSTVETTLSTSNGTTFAAGDVFKFQVVGNQLRVFKNSVEIVALAVTDSTIPSGGAPGIGGFGVLGVVLFGSWQGDNIASVGDTQEWLGSYPQRRPSAPNVGY